MYMIRYDLRVRPDGALTHAEQYRQALEMAKWGDSHGCSGIVLSEHHDAEDGFMHSPLTLATAVLAATTNVGCSINALLLPLHDPIRIAEEMATIDLLAPGRLQVTLGLGYRPEEYDMFGKDLHTRGVDFEDAVNAMIRAWSGERFDYRGRTGRVHPTSATRPHPIIKIGGSVPASARRAARMRLPFAPSVADPSLIELYYAESARLGFAEASGSVFTGPGCVMVTRDPDALWDRIGGHLVADAEVYASWLGESHTSTWRVNRPTVEILKAAPQYAIVTPEQCVELIERDGVAVMHPLIGGIDPEIGWESLRLMVDEVMPALA